MTCIGRCLCLGLLLLGEPLVSGCATIVSPLQPGDLTSITKPDHGLVLGRVHLVWNGKELGGQPRAPLDVRWRITEEQSKTQLVINHLPVDGPFAVDLPVGSYRLTTMSFDNTLGVWQTSSLPAQFIVRPNECTYLGTWNLQMQTRFYSGSITRLVLDEKDTAQHDLNNILGKQRAWPPMVAQLMESAESPLVLTFQSQGTQLTSPP